MKKTRSLKESESRGSTLATTMVLVLLVSISSVGLIKLTQQTETMQGMRLHRQEAFYTAENVFLDGVKRVADSQPADFKGSFSLAGGTASTALPYTLDSSVTSASVSIVDDPMGVTDNYVVTSAATVGGKTRRIQGLVRKDPPSQVFDYEYFLNNWGWWWGSSISGFGSQRSNWDFDFRDSPTVNGSIFAAGQVESNQTAVNPFTTTPFAGMAQADPVTYVHAGAPQLKMPNLKDMNYYAAKADGTITIGGSTIVNHVYSNDTDRKGIYLEGTTANPIIVDGPVVVHGDVVLKGVIKGQGTIYAGGNLYMAGDVTYANGPDYSGNPGAMADSAQKDWVDSAMTGTKDLVAFAVRGSVLGGAVNSSDWKSNCFDNSTYGMSVLGKENTLGADGIPGTPDDGVNYTTVNGQPSAGFDADEDGVIKTANYSYDNDVKMTDARRNNVDRYPVDASNNKLDFNNVASAGITRVDGIFYTNHAMAMRTNTGPDEFHGSIICRDEAIIFSNSLKFKYDPRVHSKYQMKNFNGDPNRIIDLGLPIAEKVRILTRNEIYSNPNG